MSELFDYIRKLQDTQQILKHCPNAHIKLPTADEMIYELNRLATYAEAECDED